MPIWVGHGESLAIFWGPCAALSESLEDLWAYPGISLGVAGRPLGALNAVVPILGGRLRVSYYSRGVPSASLVVSCDSRAGSVWSL